MIKSLELKNFQSHKETRLDFHPGVNVIIGSSRSGKTGVLRALNWNRYNKPAGLAFNSYWNRDKKKQPIEPHSSVVLFEDVSINRNRTATSNGYDCDGKKYEALGQAVPEDVETFWNMSEVNIQKQFDTPFLLSESAAEVARFFNKTIHLDKIDTVLSKAETGRRKINSSILENTKLQESLTSEIEAMNWIDDVELMVTVAEAVQYRMSFKNETVQMIEDVLQSIKIETEKIGAIPRGIDRVLKDMASAEALDTKIESKIDEEANIKSILRTIDAQKHVMLKDLAHVRAIVVLDMMDEAKAISDKNAKNIVRHSSLRELLQTIKRNKADVIFNKDETEDLLSQMPDTCPTCGKPLKGD